MNRRRVWAVSGLDLVFLVLGSVLVIAEGFDRGLEHVRFRLAGGASPDGRLVSAGDRFVVAVTRTEITIDERRVSRDELAASAQRAHALGAQLAVVAAERGTPIEHLVPVLTALRRAGFEAVHLPIEPPASKERSQR